MIKKKTTNRAKQTLPAWDLTLLYKSPSDPRIEEDLATFEKACDDFAAKYVVADKSLTTDEALLLASISDFESVLQKGESRFLVYFCLARDIDAKDQEAQRRIALIENRLAMASSKLTFYAVEIGRMTESRQKELMSSPKFAEYKVFLGRIFDDAKHMLSVDEERISSLKDQPAYSMWVDGNEKLLNAQKITWKGKNLPVSEALQSISNLSSFKERATLAKAVAEALKIVAPFSEAELNAVVTNKKVEDMLRGYKKPYEATVLGNRNDMQVVESLIDTVSKNFHIANRYFKVKAKLLGKKTIEYQDRAAKIGKINAKYPFNTSLAELMRVFGAISPFYAKTLESFAKNGQIDAQPSLGKKSGAYCWASKSRPTFVFLNHMGDLYSHTTFAHEMGHAFHAELARKQRQVYFDHSFSTSETASTLFEAIAFEAAAKKASPAERIVMLSNKLDDEIATVFRQAAAFNMEKAIHEGVRTKGYLAKEELAAIHNEHMSSYLGPAVKMKPDDGYSFVYWSHIRRFFYVYSYVYGLLVSKALLRKYKSDPVFWTKIEEFLSAGGNDSPENILAEIGIDVRDPSFFMEGIKEIEDDVIELEKLSKKR